MSRFNKPTIAPGCKVKRIKSNYNQQMLINSIWTVKEIYLKYGFFQVNSITLFEWPTDKKFFMEFFEVINE